MRLRRGALAALVVVLSTSIMVVGAPPAHAAELAAAGPGRDDTVRCRASFSRGYGPLTTGDTFKLRCYVSYKPFAAGGTLPKYTPGSAGYAISSVGAYFPTSDSDTGHPSGITGQLNFWSASSGGGSCGDTSSWVPRTIYDGGPAGPTHPGTCGGQTIPSASGGAACFSSTARAGDGSTSYPNGTVTVEGTVTAACSGVAFPYNDTNRRAHYTVAYVARASDGSYASSGVSGFGATAFSVSAGSNQSGATSYTYPVGYTSSVWGIENPPEPNWPANHYPGGTAGTVTSTAACSPDTMHWTGPDPTTEFVRGQQYTFTLDMDPWTGTANPVNVWFVMGSGDDDEPDLTNYRTHGEADATNRQKHWNVLDLEQDYSGDPPLEANHLYTFVVTPTSNGRFLDPDWWFENDLSYSDAIFVACLTDGNDAEIQDADALYDSIETAAGTGNGDSYSARLNQCLEGIDVDIAPSSWVPGLLQGAVCFARMLLIPRSLTDDVERLKAHFEDTFLGSAADAYVGVYQQLTEAASEVSGGCEGLSIELPAQLGGTEMHPFSSCGDMAPVAATIRGAAYAVLVFTACFGLASRVLAIISNQREGS